MNKKYILIFMPLIICLCLSAMEIKTFSPFIYIAFLLFSLLLLVFSKKQFTLKYISICLATLAISLWLIRFSQTYITQKSDISDCPQITGTVLYDSVFSDKGNNVLTIKLESSTNDFGNRQQARGIVTVISKTDRIIPAFAKISVIGKMSNNLYISEEMKVIEKSSILFFREYILSVLYNRINNNTSSFSLSFQLLTGQADNDVSEIKDAAENCGCLHVLALSGMHLNVLAGLCQLIFRKKLKWPVTSVVILVFVFIAGPRPSLIRAALMLFLSFLPVSERFIVTFLIQAVVFPYHLVNLGCIYAYLCVYALLFISPYVSMPLKLRFGKPGNTVGSSLAVCLVNSPLQLVINSKWYPCAVFAGPIAGFLASVSMVLGLLKLIFPNLGLLQTANDLVYKLIEKLFEFSAGLPSGSWISYAVLVFLVGFLLFSLCIEEKSIKKYH